MRDEPFGGDRKVGQSVLGPLERRFVAANVGRVPSFLETHHLTALTLLWGLGVLYFAWRAGGAGSGAFTPAWVWGISLMIALQYLSDLFDGAVGRYRNTGLVRWGFFMDHFLDYLFHCCLVVGYWMMAPEGLTLYFFGLLIVTSAFMVVSFLSFASTNRFEIYFLGVGPTEIRLLVIGMNALIVLLGVAPFRWTVPLIFWALSAGLAVHVYRSHRLLWDLDMRAKAGEIKAGSRRSAG